jgi:hypothetical protein
LVALKIVLSDNCCAVHTNSVNSFFASGSYLAIEKRFVAFGCHDGAQKVTADNNTCIYTKINI